MSHHPAEAPAAPRPDRTIAITRSPDGSTVLRLTRADRSGTWQRDRGATGAFFSVHRLTHYAVETVLRRRRGLTDFGPPWPRGRWDGADPSELMVGFLERTGLEDVTTATTADLHAVAALHAAPQLDRLTAVTRWCDVSGVTLRHVRVLARRLAAEWARLPPGGSMTLGFTHPSP